MPGSLISNPLLPKELGPTLLVLLGGTLLALGLSRRSLFGGPRAGAAANDGLVRSASVALGLGFEQADALLRRWSSASVVLLVLAALFGWLLLAGGAA